ncbi:MAG: hypothetical protein AAGA30_15070 [Planctomycetota bacterium]
MGESLFDRGKALENQFFGDQDQMLLEKLREEIAAKQSQEALSAASGISDPAVLDNLIAHEVTAETLTSLSLIPLVAVAWADANMDTKEKEAILQAAEKAGIQKESASYELLQKWLEHRPSHDLLASWKDYISVLTSTLDPAAVSQLKQTVIGRAKEVAESAGGFLGLGSVSDVETKVLSDLESSFN